MYNRERYHLEGERYHFAGSLAAMRGRAVVRVPKIRLVKQHGRRPYFQVHIGGKRHHLGTDPAAAARKFAKLVAQTHGRKFMVEQPETVVELIARWRLEHPSEWVAYLLTPFAEFVRDMAIKDVGAELLIAYHRWLTVGTRAPETIRKMLVYARKVCRWAHSRGLMIATPEVPKPARAAHRPRDVEPRVVAAFFDKVAEKPRAKRALPILQFILATGCRPGEACGLRWSEVDAERDVAILERHKTAGRGRVRSIYLTPEAKEVLSAVPAKERKGHIFRNTRGRPWTVNALRCLLRRYKAGFSPNQLRHTFAQAALDADTPIEDVSYLLGHRDLRIVQTYAQVRSARARRVAAGLASPLQDLLGGDSAS